MMELPILDYSVLHNDSIVETGSVHRVIQSHHSLSLKSVGLLIGQSKIRLAKLGGNATPLKLLHPRTGEAPKTDTATRSCEGGGKIRNAQAQTFRKI